MGAAASARACRPMADPPLPPPPCLVCCINSLSACHASTVGVEVANMYRDAHGHVVVALTYPPVGGMRTRRPTLYRIEPARRRVALLASSDSGATWSRSRLTLAFNRTLKTQTCAFCVYTLTSLDQARP